MHNRKILVTGAAGFIGYHLCELLLRSKFEVVGLDNLNDYYDKRLKFQRLKNLGVSLNESSELRFDSHCHENFVFYKIDITNRLNLEELFLSEGITHVINLAAQAGVRYSIENPQAYVDSNITGFLNILECSKKHSIRHLYYASTSSVYGLNTSMPLHEGLSTDTPISVYSASKKSNELLAHVYSSLFGLNTTALRFFTVYGPLGRPDMALFLFVDSMIKGKEVNIFNKGEMFRDFTYVSDICKSIYLLLLKDSENENIAKGTYEIFNIGNGQPVKLMDFVREIERNLDIEANYNFLPMQAGDVRGTHADSEKLYSKIGYRPDTTISEGVSSFVKWFKKYYAQ